MRSTPGWGGMNSEIKDFKYNFYSFSFVDWNSTLGHDRAFRVTVGYLPGDRNSKNSLIPNSSSPSVCFNLLTHLLIHTLPGS